MSRPELREPLPSGDMAAIARTFDHYVSGLRDGSRARLDEAFHPAGRFFTMDGESRLSDPCFADLLDRWAANPDQSARGTIHSVTRLGEDMAMLAGTLDYHGVHYQDALLIYCIGGHWRIVAKTSRGK